MCTIVMQTTTRTNMALIVVVRAVEAINLLLQMRTIKNTRNSRGYQPRRNHYKASRPSNNENLNNPYRNQNFNRNRIQFGNHYNSNQNHSSFHKNSELTKVPKLNLDSWAQQRTTENQHANPYKKQKSATARGKL